jgi:ParB family chromosome partitioning protein
MSEDNARTVELGAEQIIPNPAQPRTRFGDEALEELARSIKANGIVQPIVVRPVGEKYQIVAGERRWRAAQRAGLLKIPVVVKEVSDDKLLELALVENIQREELNPVEEARAYRKLIDNIGLTQEEVAERVGKERTLITTSLRLLKLPDDILKLIEESKLTAGHGRALLLTDDVSLQRRAARVAMGSGSSVRETERTIKRWMSGSPDGKERSAEAKSTKDPNLRAAETKLMRRLGTNVKISPKANAKGGKLEIEYYSETDLTRIYDVIMRDSA